MPKMVAALVMILALGCFKDRPPRGGDDTRATDIAAKGSTGGGKDDLAGLKAEANDAITQWMAEETYRGEFRITDATRRGNQARVEFLMKINWVQRPTDPLCASHENEDLYCRSYPREYDGPGQAMFSQTFDGKWKLERASFGQQ